ncbi:MAG: condensation domain-containing protein [Planctomycetes bacterium]|nr:condensation domain-containing protein [Planctomycetota bacterium]
MPADSGSHFLRLFDQHVAAFPERPAVVDEFGTITYGELSRISLCVAADIRECGVGRPTDPAHYNIGAPAESESPWVAVVSARRSDIIVGIIATLRAGGCYVAIPADSPDSHIEHILETTRASAVVCRDPGPTLCFDRYRAAGRIIGVTPEISTCPDIPPPALTPRSIALAVFTSGSTGKPKGAVIEHKSIDAMIDWQSRHMGVTPGGNTAAFAPFGFIASQWELYWPLATGQTLHILPDAVRRDLILLEQYIVENDIEFLFMPPDVAEAYSHACRPGRLRHVRVAGGELRSCGAAPYAIDYSLGMSENSGSVTFHSLRRACAGPIPLGAPFARTTVTLLDENRLPVGDGDIGEMAVSGILLARGYLGLAEENRRRFIPHPEPSDADNAVMFLSGDMAVRNADGLLEYRGRRDRMVKIRGMRVEPRTAELALAALPGVKDCVVAPVTNPAGGKTLVAWYTGAETDATPLEAALAATLPEHQRPSFLIRVDDLPRNVNGKVDPALLPDPTRRGRRTLRSDEPRSGTERGLCGLFAGVLGLADDEYGPSDSFLEMGGNSLDLLRLQMAVRKNLGVDLSYEFLFRHPTPRAVAGGLASHSRRNDGNGGVPAYPKSPSYPLTPQQRQMWTVSKLGRDEGAYDVTISCDIHGRLDVDRVGSALTQLTRRHDILRAFFVATDEDPVMRLADTTVTEQRIIDKNHPDAGRRPFDLSRPPLFDPVLERHGDEYHSLRLRTHHIIADAISLRILMEEFWQLYTGTALSAPTQAHDYERWRSERLSDGEARGAEAFWTERFADGVPLLRLREDFPRPARLTGGADCVESWLDERLDRRLTAMAASIGVSRFQWLLGAFAVLLDSLSGGGGDVVVGVPLAGRDHHEALSCVGMFVRTLPLRLSPDQSAPFRRFLDHVRDTFLGAMRHQSCPLERIVQLVGPPRHPGRTPFFDVMMNHVPLRPPMPPVPGLDIEILRATNPRALFDMVLDVRDERDGTVLALTYARDLYRKSTATAWLRRLVALVAASVDDVDELPVNLCQTEPIGAAADPADKTSTPDAPETDDGPAEDTAEKRRVLAEAWAHHLGREPATPLENFFYAGGDSLLAIRMESRLRTAGWALPASELYARPRFGDMVGLMKRLYAEPLGRGTEEAAGEDVPDAILDLFTSDWSDGNG